MTFLNPKFSQIRLKNDTFRPFIRLKKLPKSFDIVQLMQQSCMKTSTYTKTRFNKIACSFVACNNVSYTMQQLHATKLHRVWWALVWYSSLGSSKVIMWFIYIYRINRHESKHIIHIRNNKRSSIACWKRHIEKTYRVVKSLESKFPARG